MTRQYTFINDIDVIRRLEQCTSDSYLQTITKFVTIDGENLYTMIPRQGALDALARFCIQHSIQGKLVH